MECVVPAPAALREVSAVAGDHDVDDCHRQHGLGMRCTERVGDGSAPVVTDAVPPLQCEMLREQPEDVSGHGALVIAVERARRVAETAQVGSDHPMALRQPGNHLAPLVPGLRPAVQEHDRRLAGETGAGRDVMNRHLAEVGEMMLELTSGHWLSMLLKMVASSRSVGSRTIACHRPPTRLPDLRGRVDPMPERCGALPAGWLGPVGMIHGPGPAPRPSDLRGRRAHQSRACQLRKKYVTIVEVSGN